MHTPQTELIFTKDGAELLRTIVAPGEYVLGRNPECDIRVRTELISRTHARLTVNVQEVFIEDLNSSNGTYVAGRKITECTRVFPNQSVGLGAVNLELHRLRSGDPSDSISPHADTIRLHLPPDLLGWRKYSVGEVIGQGAMGVVLEAEENALHRKLAMKRMLTGNHEEDVIRFIEEAQITAQLDHPNIVPVYELSLDEHEQLYYTMKLVRGVTLRRVLDHLRHGAEEEIKKYPLTALLGIFQKICDALAFAHSKGVLHRDLKPDNIMLGNYGEVMVMDWGLARASGRRQGSGPQRSFVRSARQEHGQATMIGMVLGSPQYMSPEQARGESQLYNASTDVYALGAILYSILTLEPPIIGTDVHQMLMNAASGNVGQALVSRGKDARTLPHLPGGLIPPELSLIVRKAMSLRQEDRHGSVTELQAEVESYQGGVATGGGAGRASKSRLSPTLLLTIIGFLLLVVVALAVLLLRARG